MKKIVLLSTNLLCIYLSITTSFAQDIITLKSGDELKALVLEVGTNEVKYKKFDNQSGPIYTLKKSEIFMIKYINDTKDIFSQTEVPKQIEETQIVQAKIKPDEEILSSATLQEKSKKANVNIIRGLLVFTDSQPATEYETLGQVKATVGWGSGQYTNVRNLLIKKALNIYPSAEGIIIDFCDGCTDYGTVIVFKK